MRLRFYKDADGDVHISKHGLTEREIAEVLEFSLEDRPGARGSRVALGKTLSGRYIRVVYVPDPDDDVLFVVTALDLKPGEKKSLARRLKKKR